ncbi:squalene synthase HpnC [Candidatus Bipolaricaulota bacterium]|nr:squalene synthase HpnC [Candidatus Bipolaricaulota bacterium]
MVETEIRKGSGLKPHLAAVIEPPAHAVSLKEAQAACLRLAGTHYENFTVISWLVPRQLRPHLAAVYAFCRTVDDLGDEAPGNRNELLDQFESMLRNAIAGGEATHPVLIALRETVVKYRLPEQLLVDLVTANRIDQASNRYETYEELLHYCRFSAIPVGRLFLLLYGYREEELHRLSDATCTALQLANFWQDIRRDRAIGRIYLPKEDMRQFDVSEEDLDQPSATDSLRRLVAFEVARTEALFKQGWPLVARVRGHLRVDLALFSRGGQAILHKISDQQFDTLAARPTIGRKEKLGLFLHSLFARP